ncbi:MAG: C/D box methylation guide ribonucleoprotein complex aNOP56 subunit [Candidatus Bathyarchaeota archaeon]|nr:C/D box methylation guide ribonucleoprotein complex aNOP56 subunit [Candidatus Bathyarchaeota archaeon]
MEATLIETPLGIILLDDEGRFIDGEKFQDIEEAIDRLKRIARGEAVDRLENLLDRWKGKITVLKVLSDVIASTLRERFDFNVVVEKASLVWRIYARRSVEILKEAGWIKDSEEYMDVKRLVGSLLAEKSVSEALASRDLLIIQCVSAIEDLAEIVNVLWSRLREWYGVYFPELERMVDDVEAYAKLVYMIGDRGEFTEEKLSELKIPRSKARDIAEAAKSSIGGEMDEKDLKQIAELAYNILQLTAFREKLVDYLEDCIRREAPNLTGLVGPVIGAKLIAKAGGLEKLAKMPASTIQVLGAEKALFRAIRSGGKPPKHGIIFQHTLIHQAPKSIRGKIARTLAAKLAIAARIDYYTKEDISEKLREELAERIKEIRSMYMEKS